MAHIKFSESRVEHYFNNRYQDNEGPGENFSEDFESITCRSIHTAAHGSIEMVFSSDESSVIICVDIPVTTYFFVTGIKTQNDGYRLAFVASMS